MYKFLKELPDYQTIYEDLSPIAKPHEHIPVENVKTLIVLYCLLEKDIKKVKTVLDYYENTGNLAELLNVLGGIVSASHIKTAMDILQHIPYTTISASEKLWKVSNIDVRLAVLFYYLPMEITTTTIPEAVQTILSDLHKDGLVSLLWISVARDTNIATIVNMFLRHQCFLFNKNPENIQIDSKHELLKILYDSILDVVRHTGNFDLQTHTIPMGRIIYKEDVDAPF